MSNREICRFNVTRAEKKRLEEFLGAIRTECVVTVNPASELLNQSFESEFRSRLLSHHCFVGSPLFQDSFESAFVESCQQSGNAVVPAASGTRYWDVSIDGRCISLKSTKAKSMSKHLVEISKLCEAGIDSGRSVF